MTTDALHLLNDKDVNSLKWRNMSYVTKEDLLVDVDLGLLLALERRGDEFVLDKKEHVL